MAEYNFEDTKIAYDINNHIAGEGVKMAGDTLVGNATENKQLFDNLAEYVGTKHNDTVNELIKFDTEVSERVQGVNEKLENITAVKGTLLYGKKDTVNELPEEGRLGEAWFVGEEHAMFIWNVDTETWDNIGMFEVAPAEQWQADTQFNAESWNAIANATVTNKFAQFAPAELADVPMMDGTGFAGRETKYARADHVHPKDGSKVDVETFNSHLTTSNIRYNEMLNVNYTTENDELKERFGDISLAQMLLNAAQFVPIEITTVDGWTVYTYADGRKNATKKVAVTTTFPSNVGNNLARSASLTANLPTGVFNMVNEIASPTAFISSGDAAYGAFCSIQGGSVKPTNSSFRYQIYLATTYNATTTYTLNVSFNVWGR